VNLLDFWPTPEAVTRCIPSEAEVISNAAFLAVHQPVRLFRRSLINPDTPAEPVDERAVLEALLNPHLPQGYVIIPVVGPSGVGKSHLIRWLGLHLHGNRHVIPIPKSTSLRRILESILQGLEGPEYEEIRKQLITAHEKLDDIAAEEKLLAEFRIALRRRTDEAKAVCEAARKRNEPPPAAQRAIAETHGEGLIAPLEGPTKDALLQDTARRRSVFRALMRRVTTGVIDAEHGEFAAGDFEFAAVNPSRLPDPKLQRYVTKLRTDTQRERETAAALMNEVRDGAVGQLLGLGENQLADLFRRVREELFKEGKELVLLIEDFTTLAGVQRGLLDVIKMEGVRPGDAERCTLRTALAVTEGFLSPYDTLKTQVRHEYVLREQPAADAELLETITNMVGAYLNAARLGPERLQDWFDGTHRDLDASPPSFEPAAKSLSDADRALLEAFGTTTRGEYSLFPFNRAAVKRLALQHLGGGGPLRLNPRDLITDVLHATLLYDRDAFARGEFPPENFHGFNPNDLGIDVTAWLASLRKIDHRRYSVLRGTQRGPAPGAGRATAGDAGRSLAGLPAGVRGQPPPRPRLRSPPIGRPARRRRRPLRRRCGEVAGDAGAGPQVVPGRRRIPRRTSRARPERPPGPRVRGRTRGREDRGCRHRPPRGDGRVGERQPRLARHTVRQEGVHGGMRGAALPGEEPGGAPGGRRVRDAPSVCEGLRRVGRVRGHRGG
jgi:hypothetical protein